MGRIQALYLGQRKPLCPPPLDPETARKEVPSPPPTAFSAHLAESHLLPFDFQPSAHQSQGPPTKLSPPTWEEGGWNQ